jgi:hypothetical protein
MLDYLEYIVGDVYLPYWSNLDYKIFFKDDKPYGVIAISDGYVMSATKNDSKFTLSMFKYILQLHKSGERLDIIFNDTNKDNISTILLKYGGSITRVENSNIWSNYDRT